VPFKIKDLMIDITSLRKPNIGGTVCPQFSVLCGPCSVSIHCGHCSFVVSCAFGCSAAISATCGHQCSFLPTPCFGCSVAITNPCHLHCTHIGSQCPGGTGPCGFSIVTTPFQELDPTLLKEQLKEALKLAEEREKALNENLAVQTLADAELVEGKLAEALEEVKRLKKTLK
jgi:hypothetical protein